MSLRTTKARNCLFSQRLREGNAAVPRLPTVFSCCRPDMGRQSWRFEGQAIESPQISVFDLFQGILFAGLQQAGSPASCLVVADPSLARPDPPKYLAVT